MSGAMNRAPAPLNILEIETFPSVNISPYLIVFVCRYLLRMSVSKVGNQTSSQDPQAVNSRSSYIMICNEIQTAFPPTDQHTTSKYQILPSS